MSYDLVVNHFEALLRCVVQEKTLSKDVGLCLVNIRWCGTSSYLGTSWKRLPSALYSRYPVLSSSGEMLGTLPTIGFIAVGDPIVRLYAQVLGSRLVSFTERCGLRAPTQAGFRPGLSTIHNLFTLQHFVDKATPSSPLYCCFVDLAGAYDTVPRPALWEALRRLGIGVKMMGALQSLYADTSVRMKVHARTGVSFV
jgi:hypothetical protein